MKICTRRHTIHKRASPLPISKPRIPNLSIINREAKMWDRNHFRNKSERNGNVQSGAGNGRAATAHQGPYFVRWGKNGRETSDNFRQSRTTLSSIPVNEKENTPMKICTRRHTVLKRVSPLPISKARIPNLSITNRGPKMWDRNHFNAKSEPNGNVQIGAGTGRDATAHQGGLISCTGEKMETDGCATVAHESHRVFLYSPFENTPFENIPFEDTPFEITPMKICIRRHTPTTRLAATH